MKMIFCVALALIKDGKVMMATRPNGKEWDGLWEFPGGKLEAGESPEDALVREIKEELDTDIKKEDLTPFRFASLSFPEKDKHITMFLYTAKKYYGEIIPKENQTYKFMGRTDLEKIKVPPLDMGLLKDIKSILP